MLTGDLPEETNHFFASNLLIALPKSIDDIRPIGIGTMLRKIAAQFIANDARGAFNNEHFKLYQLALKPGGMEEIVHALQLLLSKHPYFDVASLDASNAFNRANKYVGLMQIL